MMGLVPVWASRRSVKRSKSAKRYGSGVAAIKITDTVKEVERGVTVTKTIDRTKLWAVQTPQTFKLEVLKKAFDHCAQEEG